VRDPIGAATDTVLGLIDSHRSLLSGLVDAKAFAGTTQVSVRIVEL
jgi:hypothetical protein